jgi:hypothetical protein
MESSNKKKIFLIIIGGIPGIGKSFLAERICSEYKNIFDIRYLNFDKIENINKDNYLQYQQMRNDYLLKVKEIFNSINNNCVLNKSIMIILDDNFFLKSMRKKIYNLLIDKIIELNSNIFQFYYMEILLKPFDINYCFKMNLNRENKSQIPENIIINMNNIFEYSSPYANNEQVLILDIINEQSINDNLVKEIFNNKEKYFINYLNEKKEKEEKIIIKKDEKSKLIDDIEEIIRKEVNEIFKRNKENKKKGKEISIYKKEFMKLLINNIKNIENNKNEISNNNKDLFDLLKNNIINKNFNISENQQLIELIKDNFKNYLFEKKINY